MQATRFAIIGAGQIGQRHALHASKHGQLVAVCDLDLEKAKALANSYGAMAVADITSLLSLALSIDLVAICTPMVYTQHMPWPVCKRVCMSW
jgi:UDP-N-acetyl-2-amino-2-deoxyglucuronate dehydrogenase